MTIIPGLKNAKVESHECITSKNGTPGVQVNFSFLEGGEEQRLSWVGWLSPAAIEWTEKVLTDVLGWNGDDTFAVSAINRGTAVELDVQNEEYNGTVSPKIKWVNSVGGSSAFKQAAPEVIKATGLKAIYLARKKMGAVPAGKFGSDFEKDESVPF